MDKTKRKTIKKEELPSNINLTEKWLILDSRGIEIQRFRQKGCAVQWLARLRHLYGKDLRIVEKGKEDVVPEKKS